MTEKPKLVAMWLPQGLYISPPSAGYLDEYADLMFAELNPLIARNPTTGETIVEAHVWVLDTPDLPADRDTGMLTEDGMRQLMQSAADFVLRWQRLSPKHRAAMEVLLQTSADEYRTLGWDADLNYDNMKAKDAFKSVNRLGYSWDGAAWIRVERKH